MILLGTYAIPTYAVCALEYGDYSGLDDSDIENMEEWLRDEFKGASLTFDWSNGIDESETGEINESHFTSSPAFGLPMDCIECAVYQH
jgi:hypothetical protein